MTLLSKTAVLSKQVGDFFQTLWPSHNVLTLCKEAGNEEGSRHAEKISLEYFLQRNSLQKGVVLLSSAQEFLLCLPNKWPGPFIKILENT